MAAANQKRVDPILSQLKKRAVEQDLNVTYQGLVAQYPNLVENLSEYQARRLEKEFEIWISGERLRENHPAV